MDKNREQTEVRDKRWDNLKTDAGPGRPKGRKNFATVYRLALERLAEMNNVSPEDMEAQIAMKGLVSARKGDYKFWKDIHDRVYGTAVQNTDITSAGEKIQVNAIHYGDNPAVPVSTEDVPTSTS